MVGDTDIVRLPQDFVERLWELEAIYLKYDDPLKRCGFGGGPERWKAERGPIIEAIDHDGTFIDVGCANGYLLESLGAWSTLEKRWHIEPYGVDINPGLVVEAMRRWPGIADHFWTANAWDFAPPQKFDFVYSTVHCVPDRFLPSYVARLLDRYVKPGGRLIMGAYGDMLWEKDPPDIAVLLDEYGFPVVGQTKGGKMLRDDGPMSRFAWVAN